MDKRKAQPKQPMAFRLSAECREAIRRCAESLGISQTSVIELSVREFERRATIIDAMVKEDRD